VASNGFITFGAANRGTKVTLETLRRWSCVVAAVPGSVMVIKGAHVTDGLFRARAKHVFKERGVKERLIFANATAHPQFPGDFYSQIDISLDTYPYGGGITTLESLWNGVPVVTLRGPGFVSRVAADYLEVIGKSCWIADTENEFVDIAVALATDRDSLIETRGVLQSTLASSPLLDGRRFAANLESAWLEMLQGS
jgi:predicted O-linked N-acetylglucosamine transferase (SPINDLY family)